MSYFDGVAKKKHELMNQAALHNTFVGRVLNVTPTHTELATQFGIMKVPPSAHDRLGATRIRVNTALGVSDIPF